MNSLPQLLDITPRTLQAKFAPEKHVFATGSYAYMTHEAGLGVSMDPLLQVDHFHMPHPTFRPHPHAGMSAVTYMLEDAKTGFVNRDSLGDVSHIRPGDLHWTQAGSGLLHEEVPIAPGQGAHGLQIFVNLSALHKKLMPRAFHLPREEMPMIEGTDGSRVKVVCGSFLGETSPITTLLATPLTILDIQLEPRAKLAIPLPAVETNTVILTLRGSSDSPSGSLQTGESGHYGRSTGGQILLAAGAHGLHAILLQGTPLDEPVHRKGTFVGSTAADIVQYQKRFMAGEMGQLAASF